MGVRRAGYVRHFVWLACLVTLTGCSAAALKESHGYIPDEVLLADVRVGLDTKETVNRILGTPGTDGLVDDLGWYYVRTERERFLWRAPVEVDREVLLISFTDKDVVSNIERFGLEEGRVVVLNRRVTTSNTRDISFLRQLFSNLGNFNTGQFVGDN